MCCPIRNAHSICSSEEGCKSRGEQCLMLKVKDRWVKAEMPLQRDDFQIQRIMKKTKAKFDNKNKNRLSEVNRRSFVESLQKITMNLAPRNWEAMVLADGILSRDQKQNKITVLRDYIGPGASRTARVLEETPLVRLCREEESEVGRNEQHGAQENQGGSLEGGVQQAGEEHPGAALNNNINNAHSNEETSCGDFNSGGSDYERAYQQRTKRQKNRKRKSGIEDDDDFIEARIPRNLLARLSMLGAKLDVSLRCHLTYTMAFYEVCGENLYLIALPLL